MLDAFPLAIGGPLRDWGGKTEAFRLTLHPDKYTNTQIHKYTTTQIEKTHEKRWPTDRQGMEGKWKPLNSGIQMKIAPHTQQDTQRRG